MAIKSWISIRILLQRRRLMPLLGIVPIAITWCRSTHSLSKQDDRPEVNDDQFIPPATRKPIVASTLVDTPSPDGVASDSDDKEDSANVHVVAAESEPGSSTSDQVVPVSLMTDETQSQAAPIWTLSELEVIALQQNPAIDRHPRRPANQRDFQIKSG